MRDVAITTLLCYARQDERLAHQLKNHLSALENNGRIALWDYGNIIPGTEQQEIDKRLDEAQIILLLISSDFLASQYCYKVEMKRAIERHERKEVQVIPVILRSVHWKEPPIDKLRPLPDKGKAVVNWPKRDAAFENVVDGIIKVLDHFKNLNLIANLDQLIETVKLRMQPGRADAVAHSLQQLKIFIPNAVTLADLVVGWQTLSHEKQGEELAILGRRATCRDLAQMASQFTTGQGSLSQAIKTWRAWADAWHIWANAFEKEREDDVSRQDVMANTFARELTELQEAAQ